MATGDGGGGKLNVCQSQPGNLALTLTRGEGARTGAVRRFSYCHRHRHSQREDAAGAQVQSFGQYKTDDNPNHSSLEFCDRISFERTLLSGVRSRAAALLPLSVRYRQL